MCEALISSSLKNRLWLRHLGPLIDWLQPLPSASAATGFGGSGRLGRHRPLLTRPTHSKLTQRLIPSDVCRDFARWEPDGRVGGEQCERVE